MKHDSNGMGNTEEVASIPFKIIDIHELLPQQEPFVMVGCLTHFDKVRTTTQTTIKPDNLFVDNGKFSACGLMENVAQTCAARIGYVNKYILQKDVQIGYIGALRNFEIHSLPLVGETITTAVDVVEEVFGLILATATVTCGSATLATATIKIALKGDGE